MKKFNNKKVKYSIFRFQKNSVILIPYLLDFNKINLIKKFIILNKFPKILLFDLN